MISLFISLYAVNATAFEFDKTIETTLKLGEKDAKFGKINLDVRYRFEYADAKATAPSPAIGNTMRMRLGYITPKFFEIQGFGEFEGNLALQEDYNSLRNGNTSHQVIADPQVAELNRLWLSYSGFSDTLIKGGRQRIMLDDQRFIGNIAWRQLEQTFDSVLLSNQSIPGLTVTAGYIGRVKTIVSTIDDMQSPLFNINYQVGALGNMITYGYWVDYTGDPSRYKNSNFTYGFRFVGSPKIDDTFKGHYLVEWSKQNDFGQNPIAYNVNRWHLSAGLSVYGITLKAGMEQLDGKNGKGFATPLGTNHAFQGWADKFLTTPADGIRDVYASLSSLVAGTRMMFVYHNFKDDTGTLSYGNEYDLLLVKRIGQHYHLLAKYAYYLADGFATDTQKVWLQAGVSF